MVISTLFKTPLAWAMALLLMPFSSSVAAETREEKLQRLTPMIGATAAQFIRGKHAYLLDSCTISENYYDPDVENQGADPLPRLSAYRQVYNHGNQTTDRHANNGIKSYMATSLVTEPAFFRASFAFYRWLREQDETWTAANKAKLEPWKDVGVSPIDVTPGTDQIWDKALSFSGGNKYMAMKVMAVYGHDNMANTLGEQTSDCRAQILDKIKPNAPSQLYQSPAIKGVGYSSDKVSEGNKIGSNCKTAVANLAKTNASLARITDTLCNDGYSSYQGDYYHVIASAFITCRGEIAANNKSGAGHLLGGIVAAALDDSASAARISAIRTYKVSRFKEEINAANIPTTWKVFLKMTIGKIAINVNPFDAAWLAFGLSLSSEEAKMVQAIVERYRFEINFRSYQNNLGSQFALSHCSGLTHYINQDGDASGAGANRQASPANAPGGNPNGGGASDPGVNH